MMMPSRVSGIFFGTFVGWELVEEEAWRRQRADGGTFFRLITWAGGNFLPVPKDGIFLSQRKDWGGCSSCCHLVSYPSAFLLRASLNKKLQITAVKRRRKSIFLIEWICWLDYDHYIPTRPPPPPATPSSRSCSTYTISLLRLLWAFIDSNIPRLHA